MLSPFCIVPPWGLLGPGGLCGLWPDGIWHQVESVLGELNLERRGSTCKIQRPEGVGLDRRWYIGRERSPMGFLHVAGALASLG